MEIFSLLGKIAVSNDEANENIENTTSKASAMGEKLKNGLGKIGKACVAATTAAATAVVTLSKSSIEAYADYEQLVGGVETLFKDSANTIQNYADRAYETAGLSANEYMSTVTSFSASLLQSLGGDTEKAAKYADMAITDMADNANKMGSSMESIQVAYQGFAKQNYTMLDNLKLGYGGTKTEMERLLKDADALSDSFNLQTDASGELVYSYADIVDAIHIVQDEMGITGTTAKEASETISGSIASMKGAWQNLLTALAGEGWDVGVYVGNFVDSVITVANNLMPRIQTLLPNIVTGLNQLFSSLMPYITPMLETLLPGVIQGAIALLTALIVELPAILAILIEQIPVIFTQIGTALVTAFPILLETVKGLFGQIWDYIAVELLGTEADFETSFGVIQDLFNGLWTVLESLWSTIGQPIWDMIQECIGIVSEQFSERMSKIQEFVSTCFSDIEAFWTHNLQPCFQAIGDFITNVLAPTVERIFNERIGPAIDTVFNFIKSIWENTLLPVFTGITDFLTGIFTGNWQQVWDGILSILTGIWDGIVLAISTAITLAWNTIVTVFTAVSDFISMIWTNIRDGVADKISAIKENLAEKFDTIKSNISDKLTSAKETVVGIFDEIKTAISDKIESAKETVNTAIEKIKGFFDFNWSLPTIKLPHFSISGSFSLNPPSIPHFGVEWYKEGGVMTDPTAFGINPNSGKMMVGGEAGAEAIAPIDVLQGYVAQAVASQNEALVSILERILEAIITMDDNMGGNLREALDGTAFTVNKREFARLVKAVT